jgi:hypothetical protein
VPPLRSVGEGRACDVIPTLTAARLRPGQLQMPVIGVTSASRTPESAQPSHGAVPGDAAGGPSPPSYLASAPAALSNPVIRAL